ncbi:MAG: pilus assembly protein PilR [endosymbiont of Seepiophila jonesi]|uniref:Pilus assembly protein PilR n=1 Tax=endosymbiont of Lamellibrachia luymesi TaxID=2200907 RepID=A0A370DYT0_9GAMM|nr:MAG: pilus assembly protein PilR [endosymbiont of Lamellibrachia luymesi]RDH92915.1 MAG: pilus assembly protein PilR [endosymbiont of Seepiophila jonesi]
MKLQISNSRGFTLVELMITVAIIAIISAFAFPAYQGYVAEARIGTARLNTEPLRLALEDFFLDNNSYIAGSWIPGGLQDLQTGNLGWRPDGDGGNYNYVVAAPAAPLTIFTGYSLTVTDTNDAAATVTCNRDQTNGTYVCN